MTCPGANRPPPMALELDNEPAELEGVREERCGGLAGCESDRRGVAGAMVSPSLPSLSSTSVTSLLESTGVPHAAQNRLASGISLEQEGQRIASGDCITLAGRARLVRLLYGLARDRRIAHHNSCFAAITKCRRSVDAYRQQRHGLDAEKDAQRLQRTAKQTAQNVRTQGVGSVTCPLKHFGEDQTREEHGQGCHSAPNHSPREWRELRQIAEWHEITEQERRPKEAKQHWKAEHRPPLHDEVRRDGHNKNGGEDHGVRYPGGAKQQGKLRKIFRLDQKKSAAHEKHGPVQAAPRASGSGAHRAAHEVRAGNQHQHERAEINERKTSWVLV